MDAPLHQRSLGTRKMVITKRHCAGSVRAQGGVWPRGTMEKVWQSQWRLATMRNAGNEQIQAERLQANTGLPEVCFVVHALCTSITRLPLACRVLEGSTALGVERQQLHGSRSIRRASSVELVSRRDVGSSKPQPPTACNVRACRSPGGVEAAGRE